MNHRCLVVLIVSLLCGASSATPNPLRTTLLGNVRCNSWVQNNTTHPCDLTGITCNDERNAIISIIITPSQRCASVYGTITVQTAFPFLRTLSIDGVLGLQNVELAGANLEQVFIKFTKETNSPTPKPTTRAPATVAPPATCNPEPTTTAQTTSAPTSAPTTAPTTAPGTSAPTTAPTTA
eukprot:PhM_4_TR17391/c1_g1_i2/m.85743